MEEYQRLRKRLTLYLIVAPMILSALLAPLLVVEILTIKQALFTPLLLLAPYYLWVMMYCRRFQRCSERYGYKEAFANQAKATSFAFLWLCTITNFYFFAFWLLTLIRHPSDWRMPLLFTIFFGAAAALTAKSILVKWKIKRGMR